MGRRRGQVKLSHPEARSRECAQAGLTPLSSFKPPEHSTSTAHLMEISP